MGRREADGAGADGGGHVEWHVTSVNPCAVDWFEGRVLVSSYEYVEASKTRRGGVTLYDAKAAAGKTSLELVERAAVDVGGILECSWVDESTKALCATHDGRVVVLEVGDGDLTVGAATDAAGHLFMSVDYDHPSRSCAVAEASGRVSVWAVPLAEEAAAEGLRCVASWDEAHRYPDGSAAEAWCASRRGDEVLSGADDGLLKSWDLRCATTKAPLHSIRHGAGVTAMAFPRENDRLVLTGSYDEHLRLWDTRRPREAVAELFLGGGVWSLKAHPTEPIYAAACMRAGVDVVRLAAGGGLATEAHYGGHNAEAVAYGADFDPASDAVASCSFYDRNLHVWRRSDFPPSAEERNTES